MRKYILPFLLAATLLSCTKETAYIAPDRNTIENGPEYITVTLDPTSKPANDSASPSAENPASNPEASKPAENPASNPAETPDPATRTTYTYEDNHLKTSWKAGDIIAITPELWKYHRSGQYEVTDPGTSTATFRKVTAVGATADTYGIFYPGDKIRSTAQFTNFTYTGQVQQKSDPMAHLGAYHSMRTSTGDYSTISFADADQSACMYLNLSGMTFENPVQINLTILGSGQFYTNNGVFGEITYALTESPKKLESTSTISIGLEGYGTESELQAWIMMSNSDVELDADDIVRVTVILGDGTSYCADVRIRTATTLSGGHCHRLTISGGWKLGEGDYSDYAWDGEVVTLQTGKGSLDLVIMGDGFIREDFDDGTYDRIMRQTCEDFFSIEPYTTLREDFNVYYVKVPSPERIQATNTGNNGARNTGHVTKLSCSFKPNSTSIKGNDDLAREYATKAFSSNAEARIKDATIIVMANQACRAGTCWTSWYTNNGKDYGQASSVAFCALGRSDSERIEIVRHEAGGHGFGKLADEYSYSGQTSFSSQLYYDLEDCQDAGLYRNVDRYIDEDLYSQSGGAFPITDRTNVQWCDLFGTANRYESSDVEALGVYKGAYTYSFGFCRPTENAYWSIMNANRGIFNAIARRVIYYRYRRLSGEISSNIWGTSAELDAFLKWDAEQIMPKLNLPPSGALRPPQHVAAQPEILPLDPPQLVSGHWEGPRFVKDQVIRREGPCFVKD